MSDKQFSIAAPWPEEPGKETRVMIDCFGDGEHFITVRGKQIWFEWSERFGPMPINKKTGAELRSIGPYHPFWRAVSLWNLQGRRMNELEAAWHEPKKPVLKHLGGKHFRIIEDGEPGHDW